MAEWTTVTKARRARRHDAPTAAPGAALYTTFSGLMAAVDRALNEEMFGLFLARLRLQQCPPYKIAAVGLGSLSRNRHAIEQYALYKYVRDGLQAQFGAVESIVVDPLLSQLDVDVLAYDGHATLLPPHVVNDKEDDIKHENWLKDLQQCSLVFGFHCPPSLTLALTAQLPGTPTILVNNSLALYASRIALDDPFRLKAISLQNLVQETATNLEGDAFRNLTIQQCAASTK